MSGVSLATAIALSKGIAQEQISIGVTNIAPNGTNDGIIFTLADSSTYNINLKTMDIMLESSYTGAGTEKVNASINSDNADLLDGQTKAWYLDYSNHVNVPTKLTDFIDDLNGVFRILSNTSDDIIEGTLKQFVSPTQKADIGLNTTARHTHTNKTLLDALTSLGDGTKYLADDGTYKTVSVAQSFTGLTDTPISYMGEGNKLVRVKTDETGLEFIPVTGGGDMLKSIYDVNDDGIVDNATKINGVDTAGNSKYYGTSASGTVGFHTLTGDVSSVFGRTGVVVAQNGDYSASQIANAFDTVNNTMDDILDGLSYTKTENNYTTAEKNKLAGVAPNAQVNTINSVNTKTGDVVIDKTDVGLSNVTNEAQIPLTQKGVADGVATLGLDGKVPTSQIPDSLLGKVSYKGTWDASTNTPTLASGVGNTGDYYAVNVAGNTLIDGNSDWYVADAIIFNGTTWDRIPNSGSVLSVNSKTGTVVINSLDIPYDNTTSGMTSTLVKDALDELDKNRTMMGTGQRVVATLTDNGDGSVALSDGVARLFENASFEGKMKEYNIVGGTFILSDNTTNYLVVNYNGGSPIYQVTTNVNVITESNVFPCFTIVRTGTVLHIIRWGALANGKVDKIHQRLVKTQRFARETGLAISESPTRQVQVTAGAVWYGANRINLDLINSATDNIYFFSKSGGNWYQSTVTQYNNSQYQDTNDLVNLGSNRYAVNWLYRGVEDAKHLYMVLGSGNYTLAEAQGSQPPSDVPFTITSHAILIGRIIVVNGATVATQIDSAFNTIFAMSPVTNHNDLADLQGGDIDDYWHMTGLEWANNVRKTGSTFVDNQVPRFDGTTGKVIQSSLVSVDDNGSINIPVGQTYQIDGQALSKSNVGLSNVDNTSDLSKPVSTATQTALDTKVDKIIGKGLSTNDYTTAEKDKLGLIQAEATKNSTDAQLRDRSTHTGEQAISTITGLQTTLNDKVSTSVSLVSKAVPIEVTKIADLGVGIYKLFEAHNMFTDFPTFATSNGYIYGELQVTYTQYWSYKMLLIKADFGNPITISGTRGALGNIRWSFESPSFVDKGTGLRWYKDVFHFDNNTTTTGTLKITMPKTWSNTMITGKIKGFDYQTVGEWELDFGGYNNVPASSWYKPTAKANGYFPQYHNVNTVRFAHDGSKCCILIGNTSSIWSNMGFSLVELGTRFQGQDGWGEGWSASIITSETGITAVSEVPIWGSRPKETVVTTGFASGWSGEVQMRRSAEDMKFLNIRLESSTDILVGGSNAYTLPTEMRPLNPVYFQFVGYTSGGSIIPNSSITVIISTTGAVTMFSVGSVTTNVRRAFATLSYY